jgi:DNA sulfur modification protein DndD
MKIRSLEISNWGPFSGNHHIDLSVSESAPVVVIHGENGRGKTSIMRAIFWCLYGVVRDSYGLVIPVEKLVNRESTIESGTASFSVKMLVDFEESVLEVLREGVARHHPEGNIVESTELTVRPAGGVPLSESKATETINLMLEEAIADFYLFDGEKLSSVEKKLSKIDSESQQFVQKSVERALGLSFMDRLITDLESIRADFSDILSNHEKLATETQRLISKQSELTEGIGKAQQDVKDLEEMRSDIEGNLAEINQSLQEFDQVREHVVRRQMLTQQGEGLEQKLSDLKLKLRHEAEQNWHWPLLKLLSELEARRTQDSHEQKAKIMRLSELESEIRLIENALSKHECSMCGAGVDHATEQKFKDQLEKLRRELDSKSSDSGPQVPDLAILNSFEKRQARVPLLEEHLAQVGEVEVELAGIRSEIAELNSRIGTGGTPDILKLEAERDRCVVRIDQAAKLIVKGGESISQLRTQLHAVQQKLKDSPELNPVERMKLSMIDGLREILGESYEDFREAMRAQVEEASSRILQELSSEREYKGVAISPKYQVAMVDGENRTVPIPSSGYSQILALSFIGGLAAVAGSANSVVMDTPWGRVDRGNRRLIMNWIKSRKNQTIIFVQSGELTISEAREQFGTRLGKQFNLERVSVNSSRVGEV